MGSQIGVYAASVYAQEVANAAASQAAGAAGSRVGNSVGECVAGAGGREPDGVNVLLPVAVPFTGDTYAWIDSVISGHRCRGD